VGNTHCHTCAANGYQAAGATAVRYCRARQPPRRRQHHSHHCPGTHRRAPTATTAPAPTATTAPATPAVKMGGVLNYALTADAPGLDPHKAPSANTLRMTSSSMMPW